MSDIDINLPTIVFEQEVLYKECRHNPVAKLGRVSHDGCPEFLQDTANDAMLCAACGCHRSFHRKQIVYKPIDIPQIADNNMTATRSSPVGPVVQFNPPGPEPPKTRKRTRFTPEQKNRMMSFAERFEWKPQRANKEEIQHFCLEMGITHKIFMVWLRNNCHRATHKN
ncbi:ZF-HD homeobox protein, Cys/His-rich dimerization domain [Sesbania bispinosa]|nr:ZF-HD homeobox protein, Cys/His-rich dimerization domain [Sesbania bispinosa]